MDPVRFRDCACPGTPHPDGDTVTFRPRLTFDQNVAALRLIINSDGTTVAAAWKVYLLNGPEAWNLIDDEGAAVPLTEQALEDLSFEDQFEIADRADDIYGGQVLAPLVRRTMASSVNGSTTAGSRRRRTSSPKRR